MSEYSKVQVLMGSLNKNLVRDFCDLEHPVADPETWQLVRWLSQELEYLGICKDSHKELMDQYETKGGQS